MKDLIIYLIKVPFVYALGLVAMFALALSVVVVTTIVSHLARPKIHEVTSPLEAAVVQDLCQKFALPKDDRRCQPGATVYAPEFFPEVRTMFVPGVTTYDEIKEMLGRYHWYDTPLAKVSADTKRFRSYYDFRGDGVFHFGFSFTEDGVLARIYASAYDTP